jgi:hypothetical protein
MKLYEIANSEVYVFEIEWSQTDKEYVATSAESKSAAEKKIKERFLGENKARYVNFQCKAKIV